MRGGDTVTEDPSGELIQGQCVNGDGDNYFPGCCDRYSLMWCVLCLCGSCVGRIRLVSVYRGRDSGVAHS